MIKGCNKRVIVMKDTGDSVFEQAFFILKPGTENKSQSDILVQAQRIIDLMALISWKMVVFLGTGGILEKEEMIRAGFWPNTCVTCSRSAMRADCISSKNCRSQQPS